MDRATTKVLALVSTFGVVAGLSLTAGTSAAATGTSSDSNGARQQAVVSVAGTSAVSAPGVHVETVLSAVHAEIVDGSASALAALAGTPGVLGISANVSAHLEGFAYGDKGHNNGGPAAGDDGDSTASDGVIAPTTLGENAGKGNAGHGVTVALIDTGVTDTAALNRASARLVDAVDTSGLNNDDGTIREQGVFSDGYGHGTFMASVIAGGKVSGSGNTSLGVAPGATIDVVKVADDQGNTSLAAVLAGLNWVSTHSDTVDVANLSLGVDRPSDAYGIDPLNYAVTLTRDAGVTVVVAAGNEPGLVTDPGFDPAALTVGAADTTGARASVASFSGYVDIEGVTKPDVVAAGVNVLGEMPADSLISQEFPEARQPSGLFRGSGTSQSTATVSGLAALYLQAHTKASPAEVKAAIRESASSISSGSSDGQGLVSIPRGGHVDASDTGESSLDLVQWYSTASIWGPFWLDDVWDTRMWDTRMWDTRMWDTRVWDTRVWDTRMWDTRMWDTRVWDTRVWDSQLWGDSS